MASFSFIYDRPANPVPLAPQAPERPTASAGAGTLADHLADTNPHPQYLTQAEADALYSALGHLHTASNITNFSEAVDDRVAALAAAGAGISLLYDDAGNSFTLTNSDRGSVAVATHEGLSDPHPQYLTAAEANAAYALLSHTHTASQITDFAEAVDDRVAALLVEGTGITLDYDDASGELVISSTGGGGGTVDAFTVDGGDPTTTYGGTLQVDFGGIT